MASEVSIIVRAIDMTKAVFARVRKETKELAKGAGFGGLTGGLAKGGAAFGIGYAALRTVRAYVDAFKEAAQLARETGRYDIVSEKSLRGLDRFQVFIRDWKTFAASYMAGGLELIAPDKQEGVFNIGSDAEARIRAANAVKDQISDDKKRKANLVEFLAIEEQRLSDVLKDRSVRQDMVKVAETEAQLARVRYELENAIAAASAESVKQAEKLLKLAQDRADAIAESERAITEEIESQLPLSQQLEAVNARIADETDGISDDELKRNELILQRTRLEKRVSDEMEDQARAAAELADKEVEAIQREHDAWAESQNREYEAKKELDQKSFSDRISRESSRIQSEGIALFAGKRAREITREQSISMGQRISELSGGDSARQQAQMALTLQQIYRLLGGGNTGRM